jgi:muconate cycloisomerase
VLDESLCSEDDARAAAGAGGPMIFAVKLAKLGGFDATLRVLALAAAHGVPVQVSCQVGESAILSAAGRHLAALCPNLRYLEGAYDRHLLADNVIDGHVGFTRGGWAAPLDGPGLGIEVDPARVERLAVETVRLAGFPG